MRRKFLSIFFPNWAINLAQARLSLDTARNGVLLTVKKNNQLVVGRRCEVARRKEVKEGSTLSLAKAFLPQATILPMNAASDFRELYKLAVSHHRYSPLVALDRDATDSYKAKDLENLQGYFYGLNLDLTGTDKLHGDDKELVSKINHSFLKSRIEARMALAPTLGLAWALSRFGTERISIFQARSTNDILEALPVEALRIKGESVQPLKDVGIVNVALLSGIPRKSVVERYGKDCLIRLDQLTGLVPESVVPLQMPDDWSVCREFEFPLSSHELISTVIIELLDEVFVQLRSKKKYAKTFHLFLIGEDVAGGFYRETKEFAFYSHTKDEKHLKAVVYPLVENLRILGPLHILMLTAKNVVKISAEQKDFSSDNEERLATDELLNFFVSKLGKQKVSNVEFVDTYVPERSFNFKSVTSKSDLNIDCNIEDRPSVLFAEAEKIKAVAMLPDSYPVRLYWKGIELKITAGIGPERIEKPWFTDKAFKTEVRDYFKIQDDDGLWLWVYRNLKTQEWFMQGMWI